MSIPRTPGGFSLPELLVVLLLVSLLASAAVPRMQHFVAQLRARASLDRLAGEIHRARMAAVSTGSPTRLLLTASPQGCIRGVRLEVELPQGYEGGGSVPLAADGVCIRHSGDSVLAFNSRGVLRPPARAFAAAYGAHADSLLLSIAGRVRRSYRRRGTFGQQSLPRTATISPPWNARSSLNRCSAKSYCSVHLFLYRRVDELGRSRTPPRRSCQEGFIVNFEPRPAGRDGFTLIEVVIAMVILGVGLMGLEALGIGAARAVALAEREGGYATVASDSLESALHQLRQGEAPSDFCRTDLPYGDRLSRRVDLSDPHLARVTVRVDPNRESPPAPEGPFVLVSSLYLPVRIGAAPAGGSCD